MKMGLNLVVRREASAIHIHAGLLLVSHKHRTLDAGWRSVPLEFIRRYSRGGQRLRMNYARGKQRQHRKEDVRLHIVRSLISGFRPQYAFRGDGPQRLHHAPRAPIYQSYRSHRYQENFRVFRPCRSLTSRPASVNLPKPEVRGLCQVNSIGRWTRARRSFTSVISCPPSLRCGQTSCSTALRLSPEIAYWISPAGPASSLDWRGSADMPGG